MADIKLIPQALFELNQELGLHPDIQQAADIKPTDNITSALSRVAAALGFSVEGEYTLEFICLELLTLLRARRLGLITPAVSLPARPDLETRLGIQG